MCKQSVFKMWLRAMIVANIFMPFVISQYVGDTCREGETLEGTCTEVSKCAPAVEALKQKKYHEFERCGFEGFNEVICCPRTIDKFGVNDISTTVNTVNNRRTQRIADRECQKIKEGNIPALNLHILGGEAASLGEYPYMVALGYDIGFENYEFKCGGAVLSQNYVLTAAHCIDTRDGIPPTIVRGGIIEIGNATFNSNTDTRITRTEYYPERVSGRLYHDVALLRLARPLEFSSNLNAICLYTSNEDPTVTLTIAGWGQTQKMRYVKSSTLLKANVTVVARTECAQHHMVALRLPNSITSDQICAGDPSGAMDTCQGDSGGPLIDTTDERAHRLVGVTSFGRGCGTVGVPGVYTRVSQYLDWIESVVWPQ